MSLSSTLLAVTIMASAAQAGEGPKTAAQLEAIMWNQNFENYILVVCGSLAIGLLAWRVVLESIKYIRHLTALNDDKQPYFLYPSLGWAKFKKHFLYAPIGSTRHNKEIMLGSAINVGTLPTRFQLLFLGGYFGTNVAFCVLDIDWSGEFIDVSKALRNRTGIMAVVNMIPLFIMAARNNPLINWLHLSFDTFNLLHRWFGRIVVLEAIVHTAAYIAGTVHEEGWSAVAESITGDAFITYGFIGTCAFFVISIQASSVIRHAAYETFKYLHIALVITAIIGVWLHLKVGTLPQLSLIMGVVGIWSSERATRLLKIFYRNIGAGGTRTLCEALPGDTTRVTVELARPWTFKPGQHAYIYMPSIGLFTSHPFSVAWSEETGMPSDDKEMSLERGDILASGKTSVSFVIRARTGFTKKLHQKAAAAPGGQLITKCLVEGPYGGMHMMHSYGTVMLFAGGIGITHQVPHVRDLVAGYANGTVACRRVVLVWTVQSPEHLEWIRPWMTSILAMEGRRDVLRIMIFVSRPRSTKEIHSPSSTVQLFPGRPNIDTLVDAEIANQIGAMGVTVCGGGALSDDVRKAVRAKQLKSNIDFIEEAFSW